METLQMSGLENFTVGGSIHLVVNNQLGFTATDTQSRSTRYATDPMKIISAPVFHVNADSPEDVARVSLLALKYREKFKKDVAIDLVGYRRNGHNELDDPSFTLPEMYSLIRSKESIAQSFCSYKEEFSNHWNLLEDSYSRANSFRFPSSWIEENRTLKVSVDNKNLKQIGIQTDSLPVGFNVHPRLQKFFIEPRLTAINRGVGLDWATCEALAIGSLLDNGVDVRLCGQDSGRGTFSQRHFEIYDRQQGNRVVPLSLYPGKLTIVNSLLSELAVVGFEYGHNIARPNTLCIWEAQFGDFINGAQTIIDTFVSSGRVKWGLDSSLVLLLPHGYDGAGPDHSSCRIERILQMASQNNFYIVNPTTPANYFHALQRQLIEKEKVPLFIVGPKTLLRNPNATSTLNQLESQNFQQLITTNSNKTHDKIILTSGKFYYEIVKYVKNDIPIIRIEQLYPFPSSQIKSILQKLNPKSIYWVQEEPQNMGAFNHIKLNLNCDLIYIGRPESAAPATGLSTNHKKQMEEIVDKLTAL